MTITQPTHWEGKNLPPQDDRANSASAVPEDFTLPWNTTRSMADVWAEDEDYEQARSSGSRGGLATKAKRAGRNAA